MSPEIQRLEEKIAYLEHHVTQQDKAMLELAEDLARLKGELRVLALRVAHGAPGGGGEDAVRSDDRPPHY